MPAPSGFTQIIRPGDIPGPDDSPSLINDSLALLEWSPPPPENPGPDHPLLGLPSSLSPIHSVPSGDSMDHISASSSVASNDDGDAGLLASILGPLSIGSMSGSSDCLSTVLLTAWPDSLSLGLGPLFRAGAWLGRAHFCQSSVSRTSGVSAGDEPSAIRHTGPQTSLNPPESMGCRCTTRGL